MSGVLNSLGNFSLVFGTSASLTAGSDFSSFVDETA
jgi:hypothetical protein